MERLALLIDTVAAPVPDFFVAVLDPAGLDSALLLAQTLRGEGFAGEVSFAAKSAKSQFRAADKSGARCCLVLGTDELAAGTVVVKDMYTNEGVGLAAPQVGRALRLVVIDLSGPEKREGRITLVNPVVVEASGEQEDEEGCLSVRDYRAKVKRAAKVVVEALDLDGKPLRIEAEELFAVCLQHEIDHLDGVLFIDHISRLKRTMYDKRVKKWARNQTAHHENS